MTDRPKRSLTGPVAVALVASVVSGSIAYRLGVVTAGEGWAGVVLAVLASIVGVAAAAAADR